MKRSVVMAAGGVVMVIFGIMCFANAQSMITQLGQQSTRMAEVLMTSVGIFLFTFGLINFFARRSADVVALRAIVGGTWLMLLLTLATDIPLVLSGFFSSFEWGSVIIRSIFFILYAWLLLGLFGKKSAVAG